jgi:predicted lipoprotein with Yx(FWY)xxD motif
MVRNGPLGQYLTDAHGRSLYRFMADTGTTSTCYGPCAATWPPLLANGTPTAGPGVTGKVTTTQRTDGGTQVVYAGHPLYLYVADKAPGQTNGQGLNINGGLWWLVKPNGDVITGSGSASPSMTHSPGTPTPAPTGGGGGGGGGGGPGY